jgi:hypothetical protein
MLHQNSAQDAQKKAVQQGRRKGSGESVFLPNGEPLNNAREPLADFFRILLDEDRCASREQCNDAAVYR